MAVRVVVQSLGGGSVNTPEFYDATNYTTVALALAAMAGGFLTITRNAPDPAGGAGDVETIAIATSQIKQIVQL